MKFAVVLLICCTLIAQGQCQNRPNIFVTIFNAIFRRNRPSAEQQQAALISQIQQQQQQQASSDFSDPQVAALIAQQQQQQQQEPQTVVLTETMTVVSTIPNLERITSIETVMEMMTQTVFETVKVTEVMTDHTTLTHSATVCPSMNLPASDNAIVESAPVQNESAALDSIQVVASKVARLVPFVRRRAIELEASPSL